MADKGSSEEPVKLMIGQLRTRSKNRNNKIMCKKALPKFRGQTKAALREGTQGRPFWHFKCRWLMTI
eukprot:7145662-Prorocentrum_lima.AAC.1